MGDVIPFRSRPRWTKPEDYGHDPGKPPRPPKDPRPPRKRGWFAAWRPWILLTILLGGWVLYDPMLVEPPAILTSDPEQVAHKFTICGEGRSEACVVDGDTFRIGKRAIRLVGVDAPEIHPPRCDIEARMGLAARLDLQRLLNAGPFVLSGRIDRPTDDYARELRTAMRLRANGTPESLADLLVATGNVRKYTGGLRKGWC